MNSASIIPILLFLVTACAAGPDTGDAPPPDGMPSEKTRLSASSVADALRAAGLTVEDGGTVEQPFFGVPARILIADGNDVQVYELGSAAAAEKAAADIAPNGGSIGTTMMSWMAPPHFFRRDRLIVNYLGSSARTLTALQNLLGPQFAGQ